MHGCADGRRGRGGFWPMAAMLMAGRGFGPDGPFGKDGPFGPEGPFGRDGPFGRGRRGGRMFASGELRLVLLRLIADGNRHGYDLIKAIEEMTGGGYAPSPGVVYPTLSLLVDEGLIAEADEPGSRKPFTVTDDGRALLADRAGEIDGLIERLQHHGERRGRADRAPMRRAMHGLHHALWGSVAGGELSDEQVHAIADILDDATRKIERLA